MPEAKVRKLLWTTTEVTQTSKARTILRHAHEAAEGFADSFSAVRRHRSAGAGATTDEEQDPMRACLVFAAAGLDATVKQLIRDSMPRLVLIDVSVKEGLEKFVAKQLRGNLDDSEAASGRKFLAKILTAQSQLDELIEQYILYLTGSSLQSPDELYRAAQALGIDPNEAGINSNPLKPIFHVRNKIIHELDINLDFPNRNRESRNRRNMIGHANTLLNVGFKMVAAVEAKLIRQAGPNEAYELELRPPLGPFLRPLAWN